MKKPTAAEIAEALIAQIEKSKFTSCRTCVAVRKDPEIQPVLDALWKRAAPAKAFQAYLASKGVHYTDQDTARQHSKRGHVA